MDKTILSTQVQHGKLNLIVDGTNYTLGLRKVRTTDLSKIMSSDEKEAIGPLAFLNNMMKQFLMKLGYNEIGKSRKYFNKDNKLKMPNVGVVLYMGFSTSFSVLESGVYLKIDSSTKVIQNVTALEAINELYRKYNDRNREEKRQIIKNEFVGKTLMANYGNNKYWRIEDVEF